MIDYNLMYRESMSLDDEWNTHFDLFISAYNLSERVLFASTKVSASKKCWWILPEYGFQDGEYPDGHVYCCSNQTGSPEADFAVEFVEKYPEVLDKNTSVCIDASGFIKPYLMSLLAILVRNGKEKIDILFSEPQFYRRKHNTVFSGDDLVEVRQIAGFEGVGHARYGEEEGLIIGSGYDHALISAVAENKKTAVKKIQIFGFPSLRADMYQENVLRASRAAEAVDRGFNLNKPLSYLAPANDPFATASVLQRIFQDNKADIKSWYLTPLATKSQAIGFALFYLNECKGESVSIVYPFCRTHSRETSKDVVRVWKYTLEFPR